MKPWWRVGRRIFVSYRRSDTQAVAEQLYQRLARHFGASNIFMDRADIEYGQRWRDEVTRQLAAAEAFIGAHPTAQHRAHVHQQAERVGGHERGT